MEQGELYFKKTGEGIPIIILHGLFGFSDNWITVAKNLSQTNEVWTLDLRNHGRSFHSNVWNYDVMVSDVKNFIVSQQIENSILLGHSMGGKVAMHFALLYPDLLSKLIVVDIGPKQYPIHHQDILDAFSSIKLDEITSRNEADSLLSREIDSPGVRQFLLKNLTRDTEGNFKWKLNLPVIRDNISEVGREININDVPFNKQTLFIRGGQSNYIKLEDFGQIQELFPNSSVITIENSGHWVHAESPSEFVKTIEFFLEL